MPGKLCTGAATNNAATPHQSRAFCEGVTFRARGTAAAYPITGNPHDDDGSEAETAWDAGWTAAHAQAGSTLTGTCCANTGTILA